MPKLTPELEEKICQRYRAGDKITVMLIDFGISDTTIYKTLRKHQVPLRQPRAVALQQENPEPPAGDPPAPEVSRIEEAQFPAWSDNWPFAVQLKWLEIWAIHHPVSK